MLAQIYNNTNNKLGNANNICSLKRNDNKFYPVKRPTTRQINAKFIFIESLSRQAATSLKHNQINKNDAMKSKKHIYPDMCASSDKKQTTRNGLPIKIYLNVLLAENP